jgi:hypothetical protein
MSEGIWPIGRADTGVLDGFSFPVADGFRYAASATAAGTAGIVVGTPGRGGRVYRVTAVNGGATPYFLQVFNFLTAPIAGVTPVWQRRLPASGELDVDLSSVGGIICQTGIGLAISSTPGTLTLAVANDLVFRCVWYTQKS